MKVYLYFDFDNVITKLDTYKFLKNKESEVNNSWLNILENMDDNQIYTEFFNM